MILTAPAFEVGAAISQVKVSCFFPGCFSARFFQCDQFSRSFCPLCDVPLHVAAGRVINLLSPHTTIPGGLDHSGEGAGDGAVDALTSL